MKFRFSLLFLLFSAAVVFAADSNNASAYQSALNELFTDQSCSELKSGITSGNLESNSNYKNLPAALQKMVKKIAADNWEETSKYTNPITKEEKISDWAHSYAKKYRVQLYEPFSEGGAGAQLIHTSAYTNMNNPTGIVGDKNDVIYVMVRDAVPSGATLYFTEVADTAVHTSTTEGIRLNQGLNIVTCKNDNAHFFINYTVATTKTVNSKLQINPDNNITKFKPIKIHIEGGRINGFFNYVGDTGEEKLYTPDTEADLAYTATRATFPMYDLIGKYVILHFHLFDTRVYPTDTKPAKGVLSSLVTNRANGADRVFDPVVIMKAWDEMCLIERLLMGIQNKNDITEFNKKYGEKFLHDSSKGFFESIVGSQKSFQAPDGKTYNLGVDFDYSEYFNNRLQGITRGGDLFMSATDWRTNYNISTIEAILTQFCAGDIWGPAHEYGHNNQALINLAGTTEESNNVFSNVAVYFRGEDTSRSDFLSSQLKIFLNNRPFLEHGTWGTTRMFWQLWCYYHATGHDTGFYPRLFELLRNNPIKQSPRPAKHYEIYDKIHFAKMCCIAAQEDLTDFFTAWGFFVPLDGYVIGDYSTYDAFLTEEEIKAAKEEIASYKFPKNTAIILIDDRPGVTDRESYNGFPIEKAGKYGGLNDFRNPTAPQGDFSFSIDINRVIVESDGNPGAGYLIRDSQGNLLAFSNDDTFEVSDELAAKLRSGEASITAVGTDNTTAEVTNKLLDGDETYKKDALAKLISYCETLANYADDSRVGFLRTDAVVELNNLVAQAKQVSSESIMDIYRKLSDEYARLLADENSFVQISPDATYQLVNKHYPNIVLTTNGSICTAKAKTNTDNHLQQWFFEPAESEGHYYVKNVEEMLYISKGLGQSKNFPVDKGRDFYYRLASQRNKTDKIGLFSLVPDGNSLGIHVASGNNVVGWDYNAEASQWYINKIHDVDNSDIDMRPQYRALLQTIIEQYKDLEKLIDPQSVNVGFYKKSAKEVFDRNCKEIQAVINDTSLSADELKQQYDRLFEQFNITSVSPDVKISIDPGASYTITNVARPYRWLGSNDDTYLTSTNNINFYSEWVFEETETEGQYAIRNLELNTYLTSEGVTYLDLIPLKVTYNPFSLIEVPDAIGEFGIAAGGKLTSSIVMDSEEKIRLVTMVDANGRWRIRLTHDKEYVAMREQLAKALARNQELWMEIMDFDLWMELYNAWNEGNDKYKDPGLTKDELKEQVEILESLNKYCDVTLAGGEIIKAKVGSYSENIDDYDDDKTNRMAFSADGQYTLNKVFTVYEDLNADEIVATVTPVNIESWSSSDAATADEKRAAYKNALPSAYFDFDKLDVDCIDGFWYPAAASARLEKVAGGSSNVFNLILNVPCSGAYEIVLRPKKENSGFFDENKRKADRIVVTIYPDLTAIMAGSNSFDINGYTFDNDNRTIYLPKSFINSGIDLTSCVAHLRNTFFHDSFSVTPVDEDVKYMLPGIAPLALNSNESDYNCILNLSDLRTDEDNFPVLPMKVTVEKNGAKTAYNISVSVKDDGPSSGMSENKMATDSEVRYYDLRGYRVDKPGHGVYIRVKDGKAEKVIL